MYKVISLFSGAGGSSLGYKLAGFNVVASVEFIRNQADIYRINNPNTIVYEDDIRNLNPIEIITELGILPGQLDILDGSPPCASFSTAGSREKSWGKVKAYSNTKQRTDDLFFEYSRFVREIQPKVFIAENVSGLIKGKAKGYFLEILKDLKSCGYKVKAKLMNAKYYNVPQFRERVIFMGVRNDIDIEPSYPIANNKLISLREAFLNLPKSNIESGKELEIIAKKYINGWYGILLKMGGKSSKVKFGSAVANGSYFNLIKASYALPSNTICQSNGMHGFSGNCHPEYYRKFTIEELKRITTFPDDYKLLGAFAQQWEACGRAVPPNFMRAIALHIKNEIL